jgi:beta-glucosidase
MTTSRRGFLLTSLTGLAVSRRSALAAKPHFFSQYDPEVRKLLAQMTLDDKIGQMTQPDQMYLKTLDDIDNYHLGSLLSGGDSDPKTGNDLKSWTDMYDRYQERALKTRLRIPLLYGVDAVHGHNNVIGATVFPQNIALGCTRDPKLVEAAARITSEEVRATGINWAFAPCVTVPQDIRWGRTYEGFSEDPDIVKVLGEAANRGLQRARLDDPLAVLGCAKHFIGDGGTTLGTGQPKGNSGDRFPFDQGDTRVDEATLRRIHLPGYLTTIAGGVGSIMPSYNSWNGVKCSASKRLMTDLLKNELGFEGFLISDYGALGQLPGDSKQQIETSINAGMDMVMVPEKYIEFFNNLKSLVNDGRVPMARIDDAVTRILRTKVAMGMMNAKNSQLADRNLHKNFGSADHRAVAREAVRKSLVVLKNDNHLLPLSKNARVHVAGKGRNDIGIQCGGWTITWQGGAGPVTKGTTILEGIHKAVAPSTIVSQTPDGSLCEGAKVGIAVIGEMPYAEMMGDRTDLHLSPDDVAVIDRMKSAGLPVVVVLLSGRPMFIDNILGKADAIVAAWLPGTEGDGVADVLFGDYKPTGKLSFTWPKDSSTSLHRGDPGYQALFPLGHGLTA